MKNRKIRLLLVSSVFVDRGVERIIIFLYNLLPKDLYEINIVCLRSLAPYADYLNRNTDIKVDVIGMKNNLDIFALMRFYKYMRNVKPDIVNFHSFRAALWGRLIAKSAHVPVILYSVHNKWGGEFHRMLDNVMSRFNNAIVPFSFAVKRFITDEEKIQDKYVEDPIYIGIDIDKFSHVDENKLLMLRREIGVEEDQNIIGFIGNVSEQKGLIYLIESVRKLTVQMPDLCCLIIGIGPEEHNLKSRVAEYGLDTNFRFLGQRYDTPDLLHVMNLFVLPSLWEGLPQVVIEAMAASCPVIATSVDGTPEIITHRENGWLVPPANTEGLTKAIKTLLSDDDLRAALAKNGYETVKEKFSVSAMVKNYDRLYQKYLVSQL
jgi:glycosyltransferase involved in cell wall biosynthesis